MKARVLMIAYACNPQGSGEHWLGWGWTEQAARAYEVELITTENNRAAVESAAQARGIKTHFVSVPQWLKSVTNRFGGPANWARKMWWQIRAAKLAEKLHREKPFALVHQTTFHTFRVPFMATRLAIPCVWGPIAGGECVPPGFSRFAGSAKVSEALRNIANQFWLRFPPIRKSLRGASVIFVSNHTTLDFLPEWARVKCRVAPPNALRPEDEAFQAPERKPGKIFQMLYLGNCVAIRGIPLVFEALKEAGLKDYKFTIVGGGPALPEWKRLAKDAGLTDRVEFTGMVPYETLNEYYRAADVLVFPALRDSGGSALLEAMSRNVPVICLDWAGPGEMLDKDCGIKIPVKDPEQTAKAFGEALKRLQAEPGLGEALARAARRRALAVFRWEEKFKLLQMTYEKLINRS